VPEGYEVDFVNFLKFTAGSEQERGGFTIERLEDLEDGVWTDHMYIFLREYVGPVAGGINVTVDGRYVAFPDQRPEIIDGRTYIPVRFVAEELGVYVHWDEDDQVIYIVNYPAETPAGMPIGAILEPETALSLQIGRKSLEVFHNEKRYYLNQAEFEAEFEFTEPDSVEMDAAPILLNGRTMVPIRHVAEALGYSVGWDEENQTVSITNYR
jgi:hypothetical protein